MAYRIVPRREIGLPDQPSNMSGSPRPKLDKGREGLAVHYVGAGAFRNREAIGAVLAIEEFARSPQKGTPFEYNYIIGQQDDELVHEYAGHFRAAHSKNNNSTFFGVCLLNGVKENPTERQIDKVRWLRHQLTVEGWIRTGGKLLPHRKMPGQVGATSCPGDLVIARWADLDLPWSPDTAEPEPVSPTPSEPAPESRLTKDGFGHHLVRVDETSASIALVHYGSEARSAEIDEANGGVAPIPGQRWNVPGIDGSWVTVEAGWGPFSCIRAAGFRPSAAAVERFWSWNGGNASAGERGSLLEGEMVWVEDFSSGPSTSSVD